MFTTRDVGRLSVRPAPGGYTLDLPSLPPMPVGSVPDALPGLLPDGWQHLFQNFENLVVVLTTEAELRALRPDDDRIGALAPLGLCVTAPGSAESRFDFLSRYFAPAAGIPEDPVTGSTHATLVPYWSGRLEQVALRACQASARGSVLDCRLMAGRVLLTGRAVTFMEALLRIPD